MAFQSGGYNSSVNGNGFGGVSGKRMDVTVVGNAVSISYHGGTVSGLSTNITSTGGTISFTVTVGANSFNFSGTYTSSSNSYAGTCSAGNAATRKERGAGISDTADNWTASSTGPVPGHKH